MGRQFCFRGSPNVNVIMTLIIYVCINAYLHSYIYICTYANAVSSRSGKVNSHSKFNDEQLAVLEAAFTNSCYLQQSKLLQLTKQTGLKRTQINAWFRNRRFRTRHWKNEEAVSICEYFYFVYLFIHLLVCLSVCFLQLFACLTAWLAMMQACFLISIPTCLLACLTIYTYGRLIYRLVYTRFILCSALAYLYMYTY